MIKHNKLQDPLLGQVHEGRQVHATLEEIKPNHVERYKWAIERLKEFKDINTVLDAAAGVGYGSAMLADAGYEVTSVELNPQAIAYGKRYWHRDGLTRMRVNLDAWKPPEYDAIVSIETIEHIADDDNLIRNFANSAPILIGSVPNETLIPFDRKTHIHHERHYTVEEIEYACGIMGYKITQWACQRDKYPGTVYPGTDGVGLLFLAVRS